MNKNKRTRRQTTTPTRKSAKRAILTTTRRNNRTNTRATTPRRDADGYDEYGSQNFLLSEFPTTSTKFQRKERDPANNSKVLKPTPPDITPTTWDFRSLFDGSFIEIETKTKTQARTATSKDEDGNVIDDLDRLATYPEGQLHQIALGQGEFKPKMAIDTKIQARNLSKLLDTKLQLGDRHQPPEAGDDDQKQSKSTKSKTTTTTKSKSKAKLEAHGTAVLELGDDENAWNSLKNFGNSGHLYSGFLDPIELPAHITSPPLVNLLAARVLANKLYSKVQNSIAEGVQAGMEEGDSMGKPPGTKSRRETMESHHRLAEEEAAKDQAYSWFAKASWAGDGDSSLQMAQIFDEVLSLRIGLGSIDPILTIPAAHQITEENAEAAKAWKHHPKLKDLHPGPVFQLTPATFNQIESAYAALTDALMPRLHGKQLQGIDYKAHHPVITTLYYYETFILQSQDSEALSVYCEWLFGLDEIFSQSVGKSDVKMVMEQIVSGQRKMTVDGIKWDEGMSGKKGQSVLDVDEDQDGDVYLVSNYFAGEPDSGQAPPQPHANDDPYTIVPNNEDETPQQTQIQEQPDITRSGYFPQPDSFIGSYLQAYLKPLTLHPIHGPAAQILLDSFQGSATSSRYM